MDRYGASSRHYDFDSASDTGRDDSPRSCGPPRRPLRSHPAPRAPTLGRGARPDPYTSDDDGDFAPRGHHHDHHHAHVGGVRDAEPFGSDDDGDFDDWEFHYDNGHADGACGANLYTSDDDSEIETRGRRPVYGRGRAGGMNRDGTRIVIRRYRGRHSGRARFGGDYSDDDEESECEHHASARGGLTGSEMRFDTDSSDECAADLFSHGPFGLGGRRSTATYPPRRGDAPQDSSSDEDELDHHVASSRRGRGAMGAPRRGMMAPPARSSHGRATGIVGALSAGAGRRGL